jgi:hypothetical protein
MNDNILGGTIREAMINIVLFYKNCSGDIKAYDHEDNEHTLALSFKEGSGYLVTDDPLMDKIVYKFTISGIGYYKHIELYA